ncbi:K+-sensing histidine kinase KdpD (KdpD) [Fructobacillus cardui]|uniref:histidine kinase n=5 Tax=Fructobacillus TaxID=559173 RepID=A0ABN9YQR7_9LACO|nr:Signal transduction histidine-protein kinase ArlS [Fructobacillus sp. EFB-N1]CAK1228364.1 K+-sensing histidine kinase KdpD (KdpD) [Fructobacillus cardui]CAK1233746.1 K+-sensing histidine kinase KdpD (KdpD) [Fructobacillus cardui]CAK1235868.1 K+-sensing histidine kinase KdpD (KdpD) [Fructobacillus cardui]
MLRSQIKMIIVITISFSMMMIFGVGHKLLNDVKLSTWQITASLKKNEIDSDHDWDDWRKNSTVDINHSYIYVHNLRQDAEARYYFSPRADDLLQKKMIKVPFINNLYYRPGFGFLYRRFVSSNGIYYTLWQNIGPQLSILMRVIEVSAILLAVTLVLAPIYIRRLTARLTDPLTDLSTSTQVIHQAEQSGLIQLPVPSQPTEVTELAQDFNHLLALLNQRQDQQKLFVMNAAHELRTPIATIKSHAQLIDRHGADHPEIIEKSVTYITKESRAMQQIIEDLLAILRVETLSLALTRMNVTTAVSEIMQPLEKPIPQKLILQLEPNLMAQTNLEALEQILHNLIQNASKYSKPSDPIVVTLANKENASVSLTVMDQGLGIPEADKAHIFEHFYRSDDVRGSIPGTGLGLAITKQFVDLIHGHLSVADNPTGGTIFTLLLPSAIDTTGQSDHS